jgi:hypothetical protein
MDRLRVLAKITPERLWILQVGLRVPLLGVNEKWKLGGVSKEEDRGVVPDKVPVSLSRLDLDRETTRVTSLRKEKYGRS